MSCDHCNRRAATLFRSGPVHTHAFRVTYRFCDVPAVPDDGEEGTRTIGCNYSMSSNCGDLTRCFSLLTGMADRAAQE